MSKMNKMNRYLSAKKYSNIDLFEKREREFELKSNPDKRTKYAWLKKLLRKNTNFSVPILSTSITYFNSDKNRQLNLRNQFFSKSFKDKKMMLIKKIKNKKVSKIQSKIYNSILTENKFINSFREISSYNRLNNNYDIHKRRKNRSLLNNFGKNRTSYSNNNLYNYVLFNNFSSLHNADILIHFESEKNMAKKNNEKEIFYKKINNNRIRSPFIFDRIKSENSTKRVIEYKNKKFNLKREPVYEYINKTNEFKYVQYSSKTKEEKSIIFKENYQNKIESYNDKSKTLEKNKKLLNFKFVDKLSNYTKFIYYKKELEKNKSEILINKIISYKNEIKLLNYKIKKKIAEKSNILKWIYFQIRLKEKKLLLPSYYRAIIENINSKENKNENALLCKSAKIDDFVDKELFYDCEFDFNNPVNLGEIRKIESYKNHPIFVSIEEFDNIFDFLKKKNISSMEYYYNLKMKIFYLNKELSNTKNAMNQIQNRHDKSCGMIQNEINKINNFIKCKNELIQHFKKNKIKDNILSFNLTPKNTHRYNLYKNKVEISNVVPDKVTIIYNSCKLLKKSFKFNKEKKTTNKNNNISKILSELKYITFVVDYLLAQIKNYKNSENGKNGLLNKLKNEIEKNHKIQKAIEQREKDKEKAMNLYNQIEERNNKIYFLPNKKIESYDNINNRKRLSKTSAINKRSSLDLII